MQRRVWGGGRATDILQNCNKHLVGSALLLSMQVMLTRAKTRQGVRQGRAGSHVYEAAELSRGQSLDSDLFR